MALEFEIKLNDGVSAAAGSAAHQVDVLAKQMRGLQTAMIKANALGNEKAFSKAATDYQKLGKEVERLGGVMPRSAVAKKKDADATKLMATEMNAYLEIAKKAVDVTKAIAGAITDAAVAGYKFAQARRQMEATFTALGQGKVQGAGVVDMIEKLGQVLPYTTGEMADWAKTMMTAGVTDLPRLQQSIKAAAASAAIFGDESGKTGDKIVGLTVDIQKAIKLRQGIGDLSSSLEGTGITAEEVAAKMGLTRRQLDAMAASGRNLQKIGDTIQDALIRKGIEPMREMNASWEVLSKKFHDTTSQLFKGVADSPGFKEFVIELQRILALFSQGTELGKVTKGEVTGAFSTLFKVASFALRQIRYGILDTQIAMLKFAVLIAPVVVAIVKLWRAAKGSQQLERALHGLTTVAKGLGVAMAISLAPFVALTAAMTALGTGILWLIGVIAEKLPEAWNAFTGWAKSAWEIGSNFVAGIWEGFKAKWRDFKDGASHMVDDLVNGVKSKLGIHSPSRVMMGVGLNVAEGMAVGIDRGAPRVEDAAKDMSTVSVSGAAAKPAAPAKGGLTVNVGGITIAGGAGADLMKLTEEAVVSLFERVALTQGVA